MVMKHELEAGDVSYINAVHEPPQLETTSSRPVQSNPFSWPRTKYSNFQYKIYDWSRSCKQAPGKLSVPDVQRPDPSTRTTLLRTRTRSRYVPKARECKVDVLLTSTSVWWSQCNRHWGSSNETKLSYDSHSFCTLFYALWSTNRRSWPSCVGAILAEAIQPPARNGSLQLRTYWAGGYGQSAHHELFHSVWHQQVQTSRFFISKILHVHYLIFGVSKTDSKSQH